ncbi:MAG: Mur ligase family protein [Planctomycetota bacterium]|nr:Mur ligase family protein [Planctomycetota bacterium]
MGDRFFEHQSFIETERFLHSLVFSKAKPHYVAKAASETALPPVFGLERLRELLRRMGSPDKALEFVHITGTSGKTSTATITAKILESQGLKVGLHISPHLISPCERLTINGQGCKKSELTAYVNEIKPLLDTMVTETDYGPPSYFELMLALALRHFARNEADLVVLEAGLGGRYDGTNVITRSLVSIITSVGLDHTHVLGNTKAEIAKDKLGIVKTGGVLLTAEQDPEILRLFEETVEEQSASLFRLGRDFSIEYSGDSFSHQSKDWELAGLSLQKLRGEFQKWNSALALEAAYRVIKDLGREWNEAAIRECLATITVLGRMDIISTDPLLIYDGAHNPEKIEMLVRELEQSYPKTKFHVIYGATSGRDLEAILSSLSRIAKAFSLTRPMAEFRANEDPKYLAILLDKIAPEIPKTISLDPKEALKKIKDMNRCQPLLICGSLYLVSYLYPRNETTENHD